MDETRLGKFMGGCSFIGIIFTLYCIQWDVNIWVIEAGTIFGVLFLVFQLCINMFLSYVGYFGTLRLLYVTSKEEI